MPDYAGEPIRIAVNPTDWHEADLVPADVDSVTVEVFNNDFSVTHVAEVDMDYDDEFGEWVYIWDTTGIAQGTHKAKVVITIDSLPSFEYKRIRLQRDPHP